MSNFEQVKKYNDAYRKGEPLISDQAYDELYDSLTEDEKDLLGVGTSVSDSRKQKLPCPMYSMNKVKSLGEIEKWLVSKNISKDETFILTPKYDGLSFVKDYITDNCWTRGDGVYGQFSKEHYNILQSNKSFRPVPELEGNYTIGEVIMHKKTFNDKYANEFKNPRNLVAGLFNNKNPSQSLMDVEYICYSVSNESMSKKETLDMLNVYNRIKVPYESKKMTEITEEFLLDLYVKWSTDFEIDGIIIEVNDVNKRKELGRERNNNPCYARAIKMFETDSAITEIVGITMNVSKDGRIAFVGQVTPVELDGVTVSNVTLNNASMIMENKWGVGAKVRVIRSGQVIPKIVETVESVEPVLPRNCPCCGTELKWDENMVQLVCCNSHCDEKIKSEITSFMKIMGVEHVSDGVVDQLYAHGYKSIERILWAKVSDFEKIEGFGKRKAEIVFNSITSKLKDVELCKVQHALNCFPGLGSKKLKLLEHFEEKPSFLEVVSIDGFSEKSAMVYLNNIERFWDKLSRLPIDVREPSLDVPSGNKCDGMVVCFTGVRDKDLEAQIEDNGGKVASSVSKKTTHLICKDRDSTSGKVKKARDLDIEILEIEDMRIILE
jgi:DNA ligase (NAD+)